MRKSVSPWWSARLTSATCPSSSEASTRWQLSKNASAAGLMKWALWHFHFVGLTIVSFFIWLLNRFVPNSLGAEIL